MPRISTLKETALYVDDLPRAVRFYREVLGLPVLMEDPRLCALDVNGQHVLLLCLRGASTEVTPLPGGTIPPHDGFGPLHAGFAIEPSEFEPWKRHLEANGIAIIGRMEWPLGGRSLYFHDPDGHVLELLTPGVWRTF
jgi:catechol 2,3-dioxygenase-like lactoylglutathione lyase family enzyme